MKKLLIAGVVVLLALPLLPMIIPEALTIDKVVEGLKAAGVAVSDATDVPNPNLEAIAEKDFRVGEVRVEVYQFDNEGKIAKQLGYQQPDSGQVIVEAWNLSESLGAAKPKNKPVTAVRNGMFMIVITGDDKEVRGRIAKIFQSL